MAAEDLEGLSRTWAQWPPPAPPPSSRHSRPGGGGCSALDAGSPRARSAPPVLSPSSLCYSSCLSKAWWPALC